MIHGQVELSSTALMSSRETVTCGTLLEASEKKWLSWFPKLRSLLTNATPSGANLAPILRERPSLHTSKLSVTWKDFNTNHTGLFLFFFSKCSCRDVFIWWYQGLSVFVVVYSGCWRPAPQIRPVRSGGRPTSHWWRSWASRATIPERHLEAGCGTALSPETPSILLPVSASALTLCNYPPSNSNTRNSKLISLLRFKS